MAWLSFEQFNAFFPTVVPPQPRATRTLRLPGLATPPVSLQTIEEGYRGTAQTIAEMRRLARAASVDPAFVMFCRSIVSNIKSKDYFAEAQRIYDIVKKHVRYVFDPRHMEYVQDPRWVMFVDGSGDCDDHAATIAAMAMALGHEAAFKTIGADKNRPEDFSHVYALIGIQKGPNTEWWAADTTQKSGSLGWEPPQRVITRSKVWAV